MAFTTALDPIRYEGADFDPHFGGSAAPGNQMLSSRSLVVALSAFLVLEGAFGFIPTSAFSPRSLLPRSSCTHSRKSGALSLRAQEETTNPKKGLPAQGLGWESRPGTSLVTSGDLKTRGADMKMSQTGEVTIDGHKLMYDYLPGDSPTVFFLPALNQTRHGTKASSLKTWCRRTGRSFFVADYYGVGKSSGDYAEATISRWASDTEKLVKYLSDQHAQDKVILVGAGVGGWVMLHAVQNQEYARRPVVGCVGVAADPDFTETLVWPALDDETKDKVMKEGVAEITWGGKPYTITKALIEDGKKMLLLDKGSASIRVECPVRLIQGLGDEEIPSETALKLSDALLAKDVVITYVKYGKHGLEEYEDDFKRIHFAIEDIERSDTKANFFRSLNKPV